MASLLSRHGFELVTSARKIALLKTYWNVPDRQIEVSAGKSSSRGCVRRCQRIWRKPEMRRSAKIVDRRNIDDGSAWQDPASLRNGEAIVPVRRLEEDAKGADQIVAQGVRPRVEIESKRSASAISARGFAGCRILCRFSDAGMRSVSKWSGRCVVSSSRDRHV
jgi:hypothetical protein